MRDRYSMPQKLDEPFRLFLLTVDEFLVGVLPVLVIGWGCNAMVTGFALGMGGVWGLKRLKGESGPGYAVRWLYWYFPPLRNLKMTPPSSIRDYLG